MKRRTFDVKAMPGQGAGEIDDRLQIASPLRRLFNKVFPDHWSFLLGEIALYSFVVLLLTGVFLTLWFDPSMNEVRYNGSYTPLKGIEMSSAYRSSLDRLYIAHVLLVPAILLALIAAHMGLLVKQKHTQWPGPGRSEHNVVGIRMFPGFAAKAGGFFMIVFGVSALLGGLCQINPI